VSTAVSLSSTVSAARRRLLRPWLVLPLAVVVGAGAWLVTRPSDDSADAAVSERIVEATSGTMAQIVSATGTIEAAATDDLSFTSAGTVTAVNVATGDEVTAGQVLATIDSAELAAAVTQAEASVADAAAALADSEDAGASDAQVAADQTSLASAQTQLAAAEEALAGAELVATVDGTVASVDLAVGEELGESGTSGTGMTGSGSGSGQSSGTLGSDSDSSAPGGTSSDTTADSSTSTPQIQVVSTGAYTVTLAIDDTEIGDIVEGQTATVAPSDGATATMEQGFPGGAMPGQADAGVDSDTDDTADEDDSPRTDGATATGTVTSVGTIADASSGVASYPVEVTFEGSPDEFYVGGTAQIDIAYDEVADAVQVPTMAVTTADGASTVEVVTDGGHETRTVETGITSGAMVQITSGLEAGEQVVITMTVPGAGGADDEPDAEGGGTGGFGGEMPTPPEGFDPSGGATPPDDGGQG